MAVPDQTKAIEKVSNFMRSETVKARFAEAIGDRNAGAYISSVMLAVANDESGQLALSTPESIYISALRAATLRLSVDPSTGQAYMVKFGNRATLVVGYKGLYDMAVRTGRYRYINTNPIYEGEIIEENRISGFHSLSGSKKSDKIVGWIAAFEMNASRGQLHGLAKTLYMTIEEIHAHAEKYSKGYGRKNKDGEFTSLWHKDPHSMERKTVLRLLLRKWGYLDPSDAATLEEIESESPINADIVDVTTEDKPILSEAQIMADLGNDKDPVSDTMWDKWLSLCEKADNLNLSYPPDHRDTYTNATMAKAYDDLLAFVKSNDKKK